MVVKEKEKKKVSKINEKEKVYKLFFFFCWGVKRKVYKLLFNESSPLTNDSVLSSPKINDAVLLEKKVLLLFLVIKYMTRVRLHLAYYQL